MKRLLVLIGIVPCLLACVGCVPLLFAGAGGAGVYAASKDTIQGETDIPYDVVWDSACNVAKYRGTIEKQDFDKGSIQYSEGKAKVWITLDRLTSSTTRLKVASRKYKMPNLDLAQLVYTKCLDSSKSPSVEKNERYDRYK
ncbi:MAG: DUF3568 family protein [Deltaproteobacteria bacterium]